MIELMMEVLSRKFQTTKSAKGKMFLRTFSILTMVSAISIKATIFQKQLIFLTPG
jgi:hypothetical protein